MHTPAPAFNSISSFRVGGQLDLARFERAIRALLARHETLRSGFTLAGGDVQVTLAENVDPPFEIITCTDGGEQRSRAEAFARQEFEPAHAPLIRVAYFTAPSD